MLLVVGRSFYDGWICSARASGRSVGRSFSRRRPCDRGAVKDARRPRGSGLPRRGLVPVGQSLPFRGRPDDILACMHDVAANGAFVVANDISPGERSVVVEKLTAAGHHVHLALRVPGVSLERVQLSVVYTSPCFVSGMRT